MGVVAALDFLQKPESYPIPPVCAVAGDEAFLRQVVFQKIRSLVLSEQDADFCLSRFEGAEVSFADVLRETAMIALFGSGKRLVVVDQAEPFISQFKDKIEDYLEEPNKAGILLLNLTTFPSNLRLYKKISEKGIVFNCKALSHSSIPTWLINWAKKNCQATLDRESAETLVDLVGDDLGVLDQETRRLALLAPGGKITRTLVQEQVGSWRQRKVWDLIDVALDGNTAEALRQLDKLVTAGEAPIAILAQMAATLRKLAAACQIFLEAENTPGKPRPSLPSVMEQVGVRSFVKEKTIGQLKKLGSKRGKNLIQNLLLADLDLKGGSRSDPRLTLERFIVLISNPQMRPHETLR